MPQRTHLLKLLPAIVTLMVGSAVPLLGQRSADSGLRVHGFLNQAYGRSNGHQLLGIPERGTWDYRTGALQLNYSATSDDDFIVQFSYERLGRSPVSDTKPDVGLDWLFHRHDFGGTSVRVGKVKAPYGIYNEIRDVGVLLPFYRPPMSVYGEIAYTSETLEGIVVGRQFAMGRWTLGADVYAGEWSILQYDLTTKARATNGAGAQLWLVTPIPSVRIGLGGRRATFMGLLDFPADSGVTDLEWHAAVDADFARVVLRGEFSRETYGGLRWQAGYVQAGYRVSSRVAAFVQGELGHFRIESNGVVQTDVMWSREGSVGVRYALVPATMVVKGEIHWNKSYDVEDMWVDYTSQPAVTTRFFILSVCTAF